MITSKKDILSLVILLFCSTAVKAQGDPTDAKANDFKIKHSVTLSLTNPLLYGKLGLGYLNQRESADIFFYLNYGFNKPLLSDKIYFDRDKYVWAPVHLGEQDYFYYGGGYQYEYSFINFGAQYRFHGNSKNTKVYQAYIKKGTISTGFFHGPYMDIGINFLSVQNNADSTDYNLDGTFVNIGGGYLMGLSFGGGEKLTFEMSGGVGFGLSIQNFDVDISYYGNSEYNYSSYRWMLLAERGAPYNISYIQLMLNFQLIYLLN